MAGGALDGRAAICRRSPPPIAAIRRLAVSPAPGPMRSVRRSVGCSSTTGFRSPAKEAESRSSSGRCRGARRSVRRDRQGRLDGPLRRHGAGDHRPEMENTSSFSCGPAGPQESDTRPERCYPSIRLLKMRSATREGTIAARRIERGTPRQEQAGTTFIRGAGRRGNRWRPRSIRTPPCGWRRA